MVIYCDTAVLIYWLDQPGPFQARAKQRIRLSAFPEC